MEIIISYRLLFASENWLSNVYICIKKKKKKKNSQIRFLCFRFFFFLFFRSSSGWSIDEKIDFASKISTRQRNASIYPTEISAAGNLRTNPAYTSFGNNTPIDVNKHTAPSYLITHTHTHTIGFCRRVIYIDQTVFFFFLYKKKNANLINRHNSSRLLSGN